MKPTVLDLFSGIGGFSLAFEHEGFETIGFSEVDPYCCRLLAQRFPNAKNYGDIKKFSDWPDLQPTVIVGGPPCHPASCAGKRRGAADDRWLWPQTLAVTFRYMPQVCLFENPFGFLTLNGGLDFEHLLLAMENHSYTVQPLIIPACAVGAGHRRNQVWIVAHFESRGFGPGPARRFNCCLAREPKQTLSVDADAQRNGNERRGLVGGEAQSGRAPCAIARLPDLAGEWLVSPEVDFSLLRGLHGLPKGLDPHQRDRIKALGNSIIPKIAAIFAREIRKMI